MKSSLSLVPLFAAVLSTSAFAQNFYADRMVEAPYEPSTSPSYAVHHVDFGGSVGINNPAGIYGLEGDYRINDFFSAGLAGGRGAWGLRFTPQGRVYPFGISRAGLFLEGGISLNTGGDMTFVTGDGSSQTVTTYATPTANIGLGYRQSMGEFTWWSVRAGWQQRFWGNNFAAKDGGFVYSSVQDALSLYEPGGFCVGLSGGFSIL